MMNDDETTNRARIPWALGLGVLTVTLLAAGSLAAASLAEPGTASEPPLQQVCASEHLFPVVKGPPADCQRTPGTQADGIEGLGAPSSPRASPSSAPVADPECGVPSTAEKCHAWSGAMGFDPLVGPDSETIYTIGLGDQIRGVDLDTGEPVWSTTVDMDAYDQKVSPDGSTVFVSGEVVEDDAKKVRIDAFDADTGEHIVSTDTVQGIQSGGAEPRFAVGPDGQRLYLQLDSADNPATGVNFQVHAFDRATGEMVWRALWNGPADHDDFPNHIEVHPNGSQVYVAGDTRTDAQGFYDSRTPDAAAVVAFDAATGEQEWKQVYRGPGKAATLPGTLKDADGLEVSPDGERVHIAGHVRNSHPTPIGDDVIGEDAQLGDFFSVAYDTQTGEQEWVTDFRGSWPGGVEGNDFVYSMAVGEDGQVFVTGAHGEGPDYSWLTLAFDGLSGDRLWASSFDMPGLRWEIPSSIEAGPDGDRVYVYGKNAVDFLAPGVFSTVAYDAETGDQAWVAREGDTLATESVPTSIPVAVAMDVADDGSTVVTGGATSSLVRYETNTFAYHTGVSGPLASGVPVDGGTSGSGDWQR